MRDTRHTYLVTTDGSFSPIDLTLKITKHISNTYANNYQLIGVLNNSSLSYGIVLNISISSSFKSVSFYYFSYYIWFAYSSCN